MVVRRKRKAHDNENYVFVLLVGGWIGYKSDPHYFCVSV